MKRAHYPLQVRKGTGGFDEIIWTSFPSIGPHEAERTYKVGEIICASDEIGDSIEDGVLVEVFVENVEWIERSRPLG